MRASIAGVLCHINKDLSVHFVANSIVEAGGAVGHTDLWDRAQHFI